MCKLAVKVVCTTVFEGDTQLHGRVVRRYAAVEDRLYRCHPTIRSKKGGRYVGIVSPEDWHRERLKGWRGSSRKVDDLSSSSTSTLSIWISTVHIKELQLFKALVMAAVASAGFPIDYKETLESYPSSGEVESACTARYKERLPSWILVQTLKCQTGPGR